MEAWNHWGKMPSVYQSQVIISIVQKFELVEVLRYHPSGLLIYPNQGHGGAGGADGLIQRDKQPLFLLRYPP